MSLLIPRTSEKHSSKTIIELCSFGALLVLISYVSMAAQDDKRSGKSEDSVDLSLRASTNAGSKEIGLPIYPGARPHKDQPDEDPAFQFEARGGSLGFKLVVLKFESDDPPNKIAEYYRKVLAKYGSVTVCPASHDPQNSSGGKRSSKSNCEEERSKPKEIELKAGTKDSQHIVGIEPNATGTVFALVHVQGKGL